jgi:phospholipase C
MRKISRRRFIQGAAAVSGTALLTPKLGGAKSKLKSPADSGIEHVVVLMMENRSFDHYLGWLPNADGMQAGLTYFDRNGVPHDTTPWAPDWTGCGHPDPDHSYEGGRDQYNGGAMDGFLQSGQNDVYSIGYYVEADRPFYSALARHYTALDRYFCSILGPTFPNRFFMHSAQTDRLSNTLDISTLPTIWDQLATAGVSGRYYFANLPFVGLWGTRYLDISRPYAQFLRDAAAGTLPAVSFVDPIYTVTDDGTGNDDHPHADIRRGDALVSEVFHALAQGPGWPNTVLVVNFDEWGGFFDHVAPIRATAPNNVDPDLEDGRALLGFRVPTVVASPFSRGNPDDPRVQSTIFDHTSVLKLIEWRWNLLPLTPRDASDDVGNLVDALDLEHPHPRVPNLPRPAAPPPVPCLAPGAGVDDHWLRLRESPLLRGWSL